MKTVKLTADQIIEDDKINRIELILQPDLQGRSKLECDLLIAVAYFSDVRAALEVMHLSLAETAKKQQQIEGVHLWN